MLDARERVVIENHLIGEVAIHLHDLIHAAERWVRDINEELAARPMSTGMTLRFEWEAQPDGPPGLAEARKRLLGASGTWSPRDREALGEFLQRQIQFARAENEAGTWQDFLAAALDYRKWHRFAVLRKQDSQWKRLTRKTHGTGPVANRAEASARRERQWRQAYDGVASRLVERPELLPWLADLQATGLLVRLCGQDPEYAGELLRQAADAAAKFPLRGVALAELAAQVAGDSHALDPGRPLGTLVLRAAALLAGVERTGDAQSRRDAWAGVGVMCDELSGPVLTLNVPGDSESFTGRALRLHAEHGEPYRLSVRQLLRRPPRFDRHVAGRTVFLCENVNVLAAAANRLGDRSAPLICIDGQPKTASRLLLNLLARAGARLVYHGDFDWPGLSIANLMSRRHNAAPWRMSVESYLAAPDGALLTGRPVAACWDARLEPAMIDRGRSVHEEQVLDVLLGDLADLRGG